MKNLILLLFSIFSINAYSQTFNYIGSLPAAIPDSNVNIDFPIVISGLPLQIDSTFGLTHVCFDITHPQISDLKISLTSPDSNTIILSLHNGAGGANYNSVCFEMGASMQIGFAQPPIVGDYLPDQSLNLLNNSQDPNGTWIVSVLDVFPFYAGTLNSLSIEFGINPPADPVMPPGICNTTNASGCTCKDSLLNDCDLLPDLICSFVVIRDGWFESAGSVSLPNAIIDIGAGPIEIKPTGDCFCDSVAVSCSTTLCPSGQPPKERVNQRIYHKNTNGNMTHYDVPAGTQQFHPGHNHIHASEFCEFSLRVATADPDPLNWPVVGQSLKEGYCMINMGTCDSQDSICMSHGQVITDAMLPNLNLGIVTGCGNQGQGLFVGRYDMYGSGFGQVIDVPNICNGDYYIVTTIDPFNHFIEEDETNNAIAVPVHLTMQPGAALGTSFTYSTSGMQVGFFNFTPLVTRTWDFGDGSPIITDPYPIHTYSTPGIYNVKLTVFNGSCASTGVQSITVGSSVSINENQSGINDVKIYPNPSKENFTVEYQLINPSPVQFEIINVVGQQISKFSNSLQLAGKHRFELNDLDAGTYFMHISTTDKVIIQRIVKL